MKKPKKYPNVSTANEFRNVLEHRLGFVVSLDGNVWQKDFVQVYDIQDSTFKIKTEGNSNEHEVLFLHYHVAIEYFCRLKPHHPQTNIRRQPACYIGSNGGWYSMEEYINKENHATKQALPKEEYPYTLVYTYDKKSHG